MLITLIASILTLYLVVIVVSNATCAIFMSKIDGSFEQFFNELHPAVYWFNLIAGCIGLVGWAILFWRRMPELAEFVNSWWC